MSAGGSLKAVKFIRAVHTVIDTITPTAVVDAFLAIVARELAPCTL